MQANQLWTLQVPYSHARSLHKVDAYIVGGFLGKATASGKNADVVVVSCLRRLSSDLFPLFTACLCPTGAVTGCDRCVSQSGFSYPPPYTLTRLHLHRIVHLLRLLLYSLLFLIRMPGRMTFFFKQNKTD